MRQRRSSFPAPIALSPPPTRSSTMFVVAAVLVLVLVLVTSLPDALDGDRWAMVAWLLLAVGATGFVVSIVRRERRTG
jgi:hypothetical protein